MSDKVFVCGWEPRPTGKALVLTKAEKKTIRRYRLFLQGKGSRCTLCLHKAAKHGLGVGDCHAKDCNCPFSVAQVIVARARTRAPGWEGDNS